MHPVSHVRAVDFDKLIDKSAAMRKMLKKRGQLRPLIVPPPRQTADSVWREQILLPADAVILTACDLLRESGAARGALDTALQDIQLSVIGAFAHLDIGQNVELALAHDGSHYAVVTAPTVREAAQIVVDHFLACGVNDSTKLAVHCIPLLAAVAKVRQRAAEHGIELPDRFWPTLDELDIAADVLATAISPKTSPVVTLWKEARAAEAEAAEQRSAGKLS